MEGRRRRPKWEDLNIDCLANVFGRVGLESLLVDVPFVCKSWYKATLDPKCWERLIFPRMETYPWFYETFEARLIDRYQLEGHFSITALIKFVVKRSRRSATLVALPICVTEEALDFVADECPALKMLLLPYRLPRELGMKIPSLVNKWKHLKMLRLVGDKFNLKEILAQISIHCNKFCSLLVTRAHIGNNEASAIVSLVPNIKYLHLRHVYLEQENLETISKGCKQLLKLGLRDCTVFKDDDDEISKMASYIAHFMHEGLQNFEEDDYWDQCSHREGGFQDGYCSD